MKTRFFAAFVAAMMAVANMSANNNVKENTANPDNDLPGVTVVATAKQKTIQIFDAAYSKMYEYNLDAQGRVSTKVNYISTTGNWIPCSAYSVVYGNEETVLTYAEYNPSSKRFNLNVKQLRYDANEYPEIIKVPKGF